MDVVSCLEVWIHLAASALSHLSHLSHLSLPVQTKFRLFTSTQTKTQIAHIVAPQVIPLGLPAVSPSWDAPMSLRHNFHQFNIRNLTYLHNSSDDCFLTRHKFITRLHSSSYDVSICFSCSRSRSKLHPRSENGASTHWIFRQDQLQLSRCSIG